MSFLDRVTAWVRGPAPRRGSAPRRPQSPELRVEASLATDPGCVRELNEDALRIVRPTTAAGVAERGVLAVVCDGMGGHEGGEIASRLAVETVVRRFEEESGDPATMLPRALRAANRAVHEAAARNPALVGMGTTCTALVLRDGLAYSAHVGDSRLYLVRDRELFLMTEDHSEVMEMVRRGVISRDEARHHPNKNVISRALGSHEDVLVSVWPRPFAVHAGDAFLLCSDGLYDLVDEPLLLATALDAHPQVVCDRLVTLARSFGGHDNISVAMLVMRAADDAPPDPRATRQAEIPAGLLQGVRHAPGAGASPEVAS